jgi:hypothetical protein
MNIELIQISKVKSNPSNPRIIKDSKFSKLVNSIKEFPEMMKLRPIVVNQDMMVLGGNMRLKACKEAGLKEVYIIKATELTLEQQNEFIIKDNVSFGEWSWESLANEWNIEELEAWGVDVPSFAPEIDYDILNDDDVSSELEDMTNGVKKAIQIEFEAEHYEDAYALVKFWRDEGAYVGGIIMEYLKAEKDKL